MHVEGEEPLETLGAGLQRDLDARALGGGHPEAEIVAVGVGADAVLALEVTKSPSRRVFTRERETTATVARITADVPPICKVLTEEVSNRNRLGSLRPICLSNLCARRLYRLETAPTMASRDKQPVTTSKDAAERIESWGSPERVTTRPKPRATIRTARGNSRQGRM